MRLLLAVLAASALCHAQNWAFVRVAASNTPRPDGFGGFNLNVATRPAMDGTKIVFTTVQAGSSIWSFDLATSRFVRLADTTLAAPGGTGNFIDFASLDSKPLVRDGTVVFLAYDAKTTRPTQGIFSVPVDGGPVQRIANYNSPSPTGGAFAQFDESARQPWGSFSLHSGKAVFTATKADGNPGIFSANPDGTGLTRIADRDVIYPLPPPTPFAEVKLWQNPAVWRDTVVFYGQTIMDSSAGFNGIFALPVSGGGVPVPWFNSNTPLPGDPGPNTHSRIIVPSIQFEDQTVAFVADDPATNGNNRFRGLYTIPRGGGALRRIADVTSTLPGIGPLLPTSFASYSLNGGRILFRVAGGPKEGFSGGEQALMLWDQGTITKVIAVGDMLDGRVVRQVYDLSPQAMSGGRFTFLVDLGSGPGPGLAVYAAVPVSNTSVTGVQHSASYTSNVVSPGGIVTVYGTNIGTPELQTFAFDANNRVPSVLAASRVLFNGEAAPLLYTSAGQASAIVPFLPQGTATADIVAQFGSQVSKPFQVPIRATDPGLFSIARTGTGPGAILNEDGSVNTPDNPAAPGSVVVLFGAGFGQTNPASVAGEITSASAPPRLASSLTGVTVGGMAATVLYQGPAPGAVVGLYQFNIRLPAGAGSGNQPVKLQQGGAASQDSLTVAIR